MKTMKKIKDERIIQLNNKIQSEAFIIVLSLLALSVFIKDYILDMGVSSYLTELIIMIFSLIYISIRGSIVGSSSMDHTYHNKKFNVIIVLLLTAVITAFNGIRNYELYKDKYNGILDGHFIAVLAITFVSSLIFTTLILGIVFSIEKAGQRRLEKKLENDDK